jgi:nitronate monooxygenase
MWKNELTRVLNISVPIIQAPMAGGPTSSSLVSAVSNAGGLGMIGAGYMSPSALKQQIQEVKRLTDKPFGVNLFVPTRYIVDDESLQKANSLLEPIRSDLGVEPPRQLPNYDRDMETFHRQINVILEEKISICSFTFGIPSQELMEKLKKKSIMIIGTATSVQEAIMNEMAGMDAVVVQGVESGGHRGTFLGDPEQSLIGLISLIPQVADNIGIPIIAAGGIMDGRGVMAAKCLGAKCVQMGTAFLVCDESGANLLHKDAIMQSTEDKVVLTKSFSGKLARGVNNHFIEVMKPFEDSFPEYPLQNELTNGIRKASKEAGNIECMSLWAGQSPRLAKKQSVKELIDNIKHEIEIFCNQD